MGRLLSLAVLSVAVAVGVFAASASNAAHGEYTLAQAYYAGIITADDLAAQGCVPVVFGGITCAPTDLPWCPEHPPGNPGRFTRAMLDGKLAKVSDTRECQVSPYDLGIITGFH